MGPDGRIQSRGNSSFSQAPIEVAEVLADPLPTR